MCGCGGSNRAMVPTVQASAGTQWVAGYKLRTPDGRLSDKTYTSLEEAKADAQPGTEWAGAQTYSVGQVRA